MRPLTTQEPANPEAKRSVHSSEALAVLALAMSAFVLNLNTNVMGALLPFLGEHFDLSDGRGSWLIGAAGLGSALGALGVAARATSRAAPSQLCAKARGPAPRHGNLAPPQLKRAH